MIMMVVLDAAIMSLFSNWHADSVSSCGVVMQCNAYDRPESIDANTKDGMNSITICICICDSGWESRECDTARYEVVFWEDFGDCRNCDAECSHEFRSYWIIKL